MNIDADSAKALENWNKNCRECYDVLTSLSFLRIKSLQTYGFLCLSSPLLCPDPATPLAAALGASRPKRQHRRGAAERGRAGPCFVQRSGAVRGCARLCEAVRGRAGSCFVQQSPRRAPTRPAPARPGPRAANARAGRHSRGRSRRKPQSQLSHLDGNRALPMCPLSPPSLPAQPPQEGRPTGRARRASCPLSLEGDKPE